MKTSLLLLAVAMTALAPHRSFAEIGSINMEPITFVPPVMTVTASPASVPLGTSATISWSNDQSTGAGRYCGSTNFTLPTTAFEQEAAQSGTPYNDLKTQYLAIYPGIGNPTGSVSVTPTATTQYCVSCGMATLGGVATSCATVSVLNVPPTATFTAAPTTILKGGSSTLTWNAQNVTSCTATGFTLGATATTQATFSLTLASGNNPNLNSLARAGGWNGTAPLKILINSGTVIGSANTSTAALDTSSLPVGTQLSIVNRGKILGAGGTGGTNNKYAAVGAPGSAGGPAFKATMPVTLDNTGGTIVGGGGGGGAGGGCTTYECYDDPAGAGGGGGGEVPGSGGGRSDGGGAWSATSVTPPTAGTQTAGGTGGKVCPAGTRSDECRASANGGNGGAPGVAGSAGGNSGYGAGGAGGAAGAAIVGTSYVTYGTVSDSTASWTIAGSAQVSPLVTTTYTLNCTGVNGTNITKTATVTVTEPVPTVTLSANPVSVLTGGSSTLTWSSTNVTSCTGSGFSTGGVTSGTRTVTPTDTTNYAVTCTGSYGSVSMPTTVTVLQPIVNITADPDRVHPGDGTNLTWHAENVTSCTITGPGLSETQAAVAGVVNGTKLVTVTGQSAYVITCQPTGSATQKTVIVNLIPGFNEF